MAEGGGEEKDDNPFSFKKFVGKSSGDSPSRSDENQEGDQGLDPDLPDVSAPNRRERRDPDTRKPLKDERDTNNPFSFKKFLQTSSRNGPSSLATLDLAHDLPDFVQDHYTTSAAVAGSDSPRCRPRPSTIPDVPLPDFALDSTLPHSVSPPPAENHVGELLPPDLQDSCSNSRPEAGGGARPRTYNLAPSTPPPRSDSDSDNDSPGASVHPAGGLPDFLSDSAGGLPDFLPDSVVSGVGARPKVSGPSVVDNGLLGAGELNDNENNSLLVDRVRQLTEENQSLRTDLEEARRCAEQESVRVSSVMKEKDAFQRKDAEETAALEGIIVQVEANLKAATERAATAEATVAKLRQEVKQLQNKLLRLQSNAHSPMEGQFSASAMNVNDKSRQAAEQLTAAANVAEHQLKQLLSGVDQLRLVADILSSGDKVTDFGVDDTFPSAGAEGGAPL